MGSLRLMGSLREDHDLTEEGWQAFEDRMNLLKKTSFGGGPMIGYEMDTVDAMDPTVDTSMDPRIWAMIGRLAKFIIISIYFLATLSYDVPQHRSSKRNRRYCLTTK
jgi:hypothetical protein